MSHGRQTATSSLIGHSGAMQEIFATIMRVAPTRATVLLAGESGVGKDMIARAIHQTSPRRSQRFVALNCSAIPETLLEAELFGYVRGAFTGAVGNRPGRLEQAHKGTLFLDEVGTMSVALQMKLLRALQEREFEKVGDSHTIKVDVRVIAATNSDLGRMVADGSFRGDLYYRLNVIPVHLPALRERKEDVPLLVQHFLDKLRGEGRPSLTVSQQAMRALMAYGWPGNVRQLRNVIERLLILAPVDGGPIRADALPNDVSEDAPSVLRWEKGGEIMQLPLRDAREVFEREYLLAQVTRFGGNISRTATFVGMERSALHRKLKSLGLHGGAGDERPNGAEPGSQ